MNSRETSVNPRVGAHGIHAGLKAGGVNFAVSIPCSTLSPVQALLRDDPDVQFIVPSREDEGVAMAVGAYLGGKTPVALMEGSGIGYCGLILARAQIQRTPLLLLIGHNRILGERMDYHAATRAGRCRRARRSRDPTYDRRRSGADRGVRRTGQPYCRRTEKHRRSAVPSVCSRTGKQAMNYIDVIKTFVELRNGAAVIFGPSKNSGLLYNEGHEPATIYNMELGYPAAIALGVALAQPEQRVVAIEGDGSMTAAIGVLSTAARYDAPNLVVLNHGQQYLWLGGRWRYRNRIGWPYGFCGDRAQFRMARRKYFRGDGY